MGRAQLLCSSSWEKAEQVPGVMVHAAAMCQPPLTAWQPPGLPVSRAPSREGAGTQPLLPAEPLNLGGLEACHDRKLLQEQQAAGRAHEARAELLSISPAGAEGSFISRGRTPTQSHRVPGWKGP